MVPIGIALQPFEITRPKSHQELERYLLATRENLVKDRDAIFTPSRATWLTASILATIYSTLAIIRLDSGRATTWDFGYYSQVLWLIGQGHWIAQSSLNGHWALTDAGSWILYPVGWLYPFLGSPGILILQAVALASGVPFLQWWIRRHHLSVSVQWGIIALYSVYPAILGPALFDWHPDALAIPAFFYAAWAIETGHTKQFWLAALLILLTKVTAALVLIGLAGPWAAHRNWKLAIETAVVGLMAAAFEAGWLFPTLVGHTIPQWTQNFGWIAPTPASGLVRLMTHPWIVILRLFQFHVLSYEVVLLAPIAALPIFLGLGRGGWAWPVWMILTFNALSSFGPQLNPFNQYSIPVVPFLFISFIDLLAVIWHRASARILPWSLVIMSLLFWNNFERPLIWYATPPSRALNPILSAIPPSATLYGQNSTLAYLSDRKFVRLIPLPPSAHVRPGTYVFLTTQVNPVNKISPHTLVVHTISYLKHDSRQWQCVRHNGPVWLFKRI